MVAASSPPDSASWRVARWTLVPLRLYLGAAFLRAAANKVGANWQPWPDSMADYITSQLPHSAPLYREFLASVVVPHAAVSAPAVACAEVAVGCCLVLGLCSRGAAAVGGLLALNYLLMNGRPILLPSNDPVFVLGCLAVCLGAAGRAWGLDALAHRRFPRLPLA